MSSSCTLALPQAGGELDTRTHANHTGRCEHPQQGGQTGPRCTGAATDEGGGGRWVPPGLSARGLREGSKG